MALPEERRLLILLQQTATLKVRAERTKLPHKKQLMTPWDVSARSRRMSTRTECVMLATTATRVGVATYCMIKAHCRIHCFSPLNEEDDAPLPDDSEPRFIRSLRLDSKKLRELGLTHGANECRFSITTKFQVCSHFSYDGEPSGHDMVQLLYLPLQVV